MSTTSSATPPVAEGPTPGSAADRGRATGRDAVQRFAVIGVWILMAAVFAIVEPSNFLHWTVLQAIFNSQTYLVFLALSLLCTLAVSEFVDLSFASVFGLSATLLPVLVVNHGWNFWLAALVALIAGGLAGVVNALLVVVAGVSTIVVTLGMNILLLGVALWMSHLSEVTGLSVSDQGWVNHNLLGLPLEFYYGLIAALVFAYVLAVTPLGRHIRAVGSNHEVSRLAGVPVNRLRFGAFILAGLLAGFGGILAVTQVGGFDPNSTQGYLSPAFAAVFLGTAILQPGRFNHGDVPGDLLPGDGDPRPAAPRGRRLGERCLLRRGAHHRRPAHHRDPPAAGEMSASAESTMTSTQQTEKEERRVHTHTEVRHRVRRGGLGTVALAAVAALAIAGCGSSKSSGSSSAAASGTATASSSSASSGSSPVAAALAKFESPASTYDLPTAALKKTSSLKGKTIFYIRSRASSPSSRSRPRS